MKKKIFLIYSKVDQEKVKRVYERLSDEGLRPWMDIYDLRPGEEWKVVIRKEIREARFILAFCSRESVSKSGYVNKEIREAVEIWKEKVENAIFIMPCRLDNCEPPESLSRFHWTNLYADGELEKLILTIMPRGERQRKSPTKQRHGARGPLLEDLTRSMGTTKQSPGDLKGRAPWRKTGPLVLPQAIGSEELMDSLRGLLKAAENPDNSHLKAALASLSTLSAILRKFQDDRTWDKDVCVGIISSLLDKLVNKNAKVLESFVKHKHSAIEPLQAEAITSSILSELMKRMEAGDRYDVISDLSSWRDGRLFEFWAQTGEAVARGVRVRRVFNLMLLPQFRALKNVELEILKQHIRESEAWNRKYEGQYSVRLFSRQDYRRTRKFSTAPELERRKIEAAQFGIFSHGNEDQTIVEVRQYDLSELVLWKAAGVDAQDHLKLFEQIWDQANGQGIRLTRS